MNSTASNYPNQSAISLPPLSSIDPHRRMSPTPAELHYQQHQHVARQLPAPVSYSNMPTNMVPQMMQIDRISGRPIYPGGQQYQLQTARMALPPSTDPNLMIAGRAHQKKEVKRRTKTGCMTCRKRRIKCDEGRPECRNCQKSKRECAGYDPPVFHPQSTPPQHIQSAPTSHPLGPSSSSSATLNHQYSLPPPSSPSLSSNAPSIQTESSLDQGDYPTPKHETSLISLHYHRAHQMETSSDSREAMHQSRHYSHNMIRKATPRSIDELCTIDGHRRPNLPPLPTDPPNLDAIKKIYDAAFVPGLDKLLETRWYGKHGFKYLVADRDLLSQFLAYITLVHTNQNNPQTGPDYELASQEARITWTLLGLCQRATAESNADIEIRKLNKRYKALQALITSEEIQDTSLLPNEGQDSDPALSAMTALQKQFAQRTTRFWDLLAGFVSLLRPGCHGLVELTATIQPELTLSQCRSHLDHLENRDLLFAIMQLHFLGLQPSESITANRQNDWDVARELLRCEASGLSTNQVFSVISGTALRAWDAE